MTTQKISKTNYRPILPCVSKACESFLNTDLQAFACDVSQHQFAYMKNSSTTVAPLKVIDSWKIPLDNKEKGVCAFLDLCKAFDVIEHHSIIRKLESFVITSKERDWFRSYLSDRSQFVSCGGIQSPSQKIHYGVPQGPVLGPTLYCLSPSVVVLYADDTEIHSSSKDIDDAEANLNRDLNRVSTWFKREWPY